MNEFDFDEDNSNDLDDQDERDSDEDTEDASETDMVRQEEEYTEIKEQMYQDKLASLKKQLQQLKDEIHPEYVRRLKRLEQIYQDRLIINEVFQTYEIERVEREYILEKKAAVREFEEKKVELKESLIADLEEKRRIVEGERVTLELTGGQLHPMEVKPVTTRKLRRRPNDPVPLPEKRRKTSPAQLNYLLEESEIGDDVKAINKGKALANNRKMEFEAMRDNNGLPVEAKVEEGKLYFDKKWFHRGQPVFAESKELGKCQAIISNIGSAEIWIKKLSDNCKVRIYLNQLQRGKVIIRRRAT